MQDRSVCPRSVAPATNHHWMQGRPRPSGEEGFKAVDARCKFCGEERTDLVRSFDDSDWVGINDSEHTRLKKSAHEPR